LFLFLSFLRLKESGHELRDEDAEINGNKVRLTLSESAGLGMFGIRQFFLVQYYFPQAQLISSHESLREMGAKLHSIETHLTQRCY